jgi:hypothetical protein
MAHGFKKRTSLGSHLGEGKTKHRAAVKDVPDEDLGAFN